MSEELRHKRIFFFSSVRGPESPAWRPRADVYRTPTGWLIKLELAGVEPQDVRVAFDRGRLLVEGTRRDESLIQGYQCHHLEIAYSRFERQWELPGIVEPADVRISYHQGMLLIEITSATGEDR